VTEPTDPEPTDPEPTDKQRDGSGQDQPAPTGPDTEPESVGADADEAAPDMPADLATTRARAPSPTIQSRRTSRSRPLSRSLMPPPNGRRPTR